MAGLGSYKSEFDIINCLQFQLEDYNLNAKKALAKTEFMFWLKPLNPLFSKWAKAHSY